MKKTSHLNYIESQIDHVIDSHGDISSQEARLAFFKVFNNLAMHVLNTHYKLTIEVSSEIAVGYSVRLLDLVIAEKWKIRASDYTAYMMVDLEKHLKMPFGEADRELLKSFESHVLLPDEQAINYEIFCEINDILLLFFNISEVKRYLPLFITIVSNCKIAKVSTLRDERFKYFSMLLISLAKKVSNFYQNDSSYSNHKDFSIGELTYLLSPNLEKHKELYLSLDLKSLINLVDMHGGQTLTVPTKDELNSGLKAAEGSFRFPILAKTEAELEQIGEVKSEPCLDTAYSFFLQWLKSNKSELNPSQLDTLKKTLG